MSVASIAHPSTAAFVRSCIALPSPTWQIVQGIGGNLPSPQQIVNGIFYTVGQLVTDTNSTITLPDSAATITYMKSLGLTSFYFNITAQGAGTATLSLDNLPGPAVPWLMINGAIIAPALTELVREQFRVVLIPDDAPVDPGRLRVY